MFAIEKFQNKFQATLTERAQIGGELCIYKYFNAIGELHNLKNDNVFRVVE